MNAFLFVLLCKTVYGSFLEDITKDVFGDNTHSLVAAYGDFDSDKKTDVFVINGTGKIVNGKLVLFNVFSYFVDWVRTHYEYDMYENVPHNYEFRGVIIVMSKLVFGFR